MHAATRATLQAAGATEQFVATPAHSRVAFCSQNWATVIVSWLPQLLARPANKKGPVNLRNLFFIPDPWIDQTRPSRCVRGATPAPVGVSGHTVCVPRAGRTTGRRRVTRRGALDHGLRQAHRRRRPWYSPAGICLL